MMLFEQPSACSPGVVSSTPMSAEATAGRASSPNSGNSIAHPRISRARASSSSRKGPEPTRTKRQRSGCSRPRIVAASSSRAKSFSGSILAAITTPIGPRACCRVLRPDSLALSKPLYTTRPRGSWSNPNARRPARLLATTRSARCAKNRVTHPRRGGRCPKRMLPSTSGTPQRRHAGSAAAVDIHPQVCTTVGLQSRTMRQTAAAGRTSKRYPR